MQSSHSLSRLSVAFFDRHAVADAGLLLPATLAEKFGRRGALCDELVDLGDAPGAGNVGVKGMTLIFSALAGGDSIDDANMLRAGSTEAVLGCEVRAPSTVGTFLRSFTWGHALQLDAVSRHLPARAWGAGAGPGARPLTIDLDSTICETYGLKKAGGAGSAATPTCGATTPCSPWPQARARSCMPAGGAARPTPPGAFLVSSPRRFSGYERPEPYGKPPWPGDRLRLLQPQGAGLPQKGRALLHHHPAPQTPASDDRRPAGGGLDRHPLRPA